MFLTKLKLGTAAVLCAGLFVALIGSSFASLGMAQEAKTPIEGASFDFGQERTESDADFIRRISQDLRGTDPTPAEIHFFLASKDAGRRQKLIDLFIQERQAKKGATEPGKVDWMPKVRFRYKADADLLLRYKAEPVAQAGNQDALKKEVDLLRGAWGVNVKVGTDEVKGRFAIYGDESFEINIGGNHVNGTRKIDPAKNPKEITLSPDGSNKPLLGIYKLEGDMLTLCIGEKRPTDFKEKKGSAQTLWVLKRQKQEGKFGSEPQKDAGLGFYPPAKALVVKPLKNTGLSFYPPAKALVVKPGGC